MVASVALTARFRSAIGMAPDWTIWTREEVDAGLIMVITPRKDARSAYTVGWEQSLTLLTEPYEHMMDATWACCTASSYGGLYNSASDRLGTSWLRIWRTVYCEYAVACFRFAMVPSDWMP